MMPQRSRGTAARTIGIPPPPSNGQAAPKAVRAQPPASDRWTLLNTIIDRLSWMPHPDRLVLLVLFRHADKTGKAWPGQTGIGKSCGIDRSHVSRCLARLVRWGVIEVVRRGHKGSRKASEYRIRSPSHWPSDRPPD